jgi:hypothetical protein
MYVAVKLDYTGKRIASTGSGTCFRTQFCGIGTFVRHPGKKQGNNPDNG